MSKVQPRPGARPSTTAARPGATQTTATEVRRGGPSPEELAKLRALPAAEDTGIAVDTDPDNAAAGRIMNEKVTIVDAKYVTCDFKRKDGTYPENAVPVVQLHVFFKREGDEDGDRPYREQYEIGSASLFVPSTDGNRLNVRKSAMREGAAPPTPQKKMSGVRFLASIKAAGGSNVIDAAKKNGLSALKGLVVQISRRKTADMHEKAFPLLLVDAIEGVATTTPTAPVSAPQNAAPTAVTAAAAATATATATEGSDVDALAQQALLDVIARAGGSVSRAQIPTQIIQIDAWKTHKERGPILKLLRSDDFIASQNGVLWEVDGTTVKGL